MSEPAAIRTEELRKRYGAFTALAGVSFTVQPGEIVGFLGPNGAGKSTLLRILLGFLRPTAGSASVLGLDVVRDGVAIRRRVGYLPSGVTFESDLSGEHTLAYLAALQGGAAPRRATLCERLGLDAAQLRKPVRDLSHGNRQKLGIVQALQHDPELVILDEPSEALDPFVQQAFHEILSGLRGAGRTVFFSSHVLSEVERICDRVLVVRQGRLVATHDLETLRRQRPRRATVRLAGDVPDLNGVPGVVAVRREGALLQVTLRGEVRPFVQALAALPFEDLVIEAGRLEDAFFGAYQGNDEETDREADPKVATDAAASTAVRVRS